MVESKEQAYNFLNSWEQMAERIHVTAREKGWWDKERNNGEIIALIHSELSEGLEALRKDLQDDHLPEYLGIEVELADAVIRIMDFAKARGYRLPEAILMKMKYNEGREHKHGGKHF